MATEAKYEMYDPKKIDAIYQNLMSLKQRNVDKAYEIQIDGFAVIPHTTDLERFMEYSNFISPESKILAIHVFKGNYQSDKYFFYFNSNAYKEAVELKGIDGPRKQEDHEEIKEQIRKDLHYEELVRENAALRAEIEEHEKIYQQMEARIVEVKKNRDIGYQGLGSLIIEGILNSKKVKETIPFLGQLSGSDSVKTEPSQNETSDKATFKRKERSVNDMEEASEIEEDENGFETYRITEKERRYILFIEDIRHRIGDIEVANIMHLLDLLASNTRAIPYAIRHTTNFLKMDKQHQQQNSKNNEI